MSGEQPDEHSALEFALELWNSLFVTMVSDGVVDGSSIRLQAPKLIAECSETGRAGRERARPKSAREQLQQAARMVLRPMANRRTLANAQSRSGLLCSLLPAHVLPSRNCFYSTTLTWIVRCFACGWTLNIPRDVGLPPVTVSTTLSSVVIVAPPLLSTAQILRGVSANLSPSASLLASPIFKTAVVCFFRVRV